MTDNARLDGEEFQWVKPARSGRRFELRAGDTLTATLEWTSRYGALGVWGQRRFGFSRAGWLRQRVLVSGGEDTATIGQIATFVSRKGVLTVADGGAFTWTKPRRWTDEREWVRAGSGALIRYNPSRHATVMTVSSVAASLPELPLLALLGQFLLLMAARDAEEATTAAMITTIAGA
ncbi:MAG TPA: hypothetical protein VJN88_17320 [Ktedonobacterales bacterium]|nr:hypothetical protein [Ktedonobacterales bacterium]